MKPSIIRAGEKHKAQITWALADQSRDLISRKKQLSEES
jgi:hypothetical protein